MKGWYSLIGFVLFVGGVLALVMSLIGVKLAPLVWIDNWGLAVGGLIRVALILGGLLMVYLSRSDWRDLDEDQRQS